jgi:hypothetical protein
MKLAAMDNLIGMKFGAGIHDYNDIDNLKNK